MAVFDLADERGLDWLAAQDGGHRDVAGNPVASVRQDALGLDFGVVLDRVDDFAGRAEIGDRGWRDDRRQERQPGALALGQVDGVRQRAIGVRRAIYGDQDVVEHGLTNYIAQQYS